MIFLLDNVMKEAMNNQAKVLINSKTRFGNMTIALHWLMLSLIIAVYACIELREFFPKGSDPRTALKTWHFMLGLSVLSLVWLRLFARFFSATPAIYPAPVAWQMLAAKAVHSLLYLWMVTLPVLGWLLLSASGKPIPFFGYQLPALISENKNLADTIKELHETLGTAGYYFIGLHAIAALFHHYIQRDNTLTRMLPKYGK